MASFDMINAIGHAYQKCWDERGYLARMALVPLLVKFVCYTVTVFYVGSDNILRLSLFMLPAYFVEGWFLSHWVRTIVLDHRWPFKSSGNDKADTMVLKERGRGILSGTISFTLINLLIAGYVSFFMSYVPLDMTESEPDPQVAAIGVLMIVSTILLFRFVWTYIPLSVNMNPKSFVKRMMPMSLTFLLVGVWLVCFIPSVTILQFSNIVLNGMSEENQSSALLQGVGTLLHVVLDTVKNLLCTAGVTYAFIELFKWKEKP